MYDGAIAAMRGGMAIESSQYYFAPKSARASIGDYAIEVANQLAVNEGQEFDFVLAYPERDQSSAEFWSAFEAFANACNE